MVEGPRPLPDGAWKRHFRVLSRGRQRILRSMLRLRAVLEWSGVYPLVINFHAVK